MALYSSTQVRRTRCGGCSIADDQALPRKGRVDEETWNKLAHATCSRQIFHILIRSTYQHPCQVILIWETKKRQRCSCNSSRARLLSVHFSVSKGSCYTSPPTKTFSRGAALSVQVMASTRGRVLWSIRIRCTSAVRVILPSQFWVHSLRFSDRLQRFSGLCFPLW